MASPEDAASEAPGLRVGPQAWKWPPVWPYDDELFRRPDEEEAMPSALEVATQSVKEDDQEERIEKASCDGRSDGPRRRRAEKVQYSQRRGAKRRALL